MALGVATLRQRLREFFEVDRRFVSLAALSGLARRQVIPAADVDAAIKSLALAADSTPPRTR